MKKIDEIKKSRVNINIDTIGICASFKSTEEFTAKSTGMHIIKRDIILQDETGFITLTLWNEMANMTFDEKSILLINDAKITEFQNQKNLSATSNTFIRKNPNLKEQKILQNLLKKMK